MNSKKTFTDDVQKACEELAEMGLIQDSGQRRNGKIVWTITPLGKLLARDLDGDSGIQGSRH